MLPVYLLVNKYKDKSHIFMINGQTGTVCLEVPYLRKKSSISALILLSFFFISYISQALVFAESSKNVKDYLNYLTAEEKLDVVIVITDNTQGKSSRDFADDFYDYNGYGIGTRKSGLLMLVNMQNREIWISTCGDAIDIFTDN